MPTQTARPTIVSTTPNTGTLTINNPDNVKEIDGVKSSVVGTAVEYAYSHLYVCTGFGFNIPLNATITRIRLRLTCYADYNVALETVITLPYLYINGSTYDSIPGNLTSWPTSSGYDICSKTTGLPTPAQVNLSNSGVAFHVQLYHAGGLINTMAAFVDAVEMIVEYDAPPAESVSLVSTIADGVVGQALVSTDVPAEPLTVNVLNGSSEIVTDATNVVTVAIASGTSGAVLTGTASVAAVNGVATFSNLSIDLAGTYTLSIASAGLTGDVSASFDIVDDPASAIASSFPGVRARPQFPRFR